MKTSNFYCLILISFIFTSCTKLNDKPELLDPIYLDLSSQAEKAKKDIEAKNKELDGFRQELTIQPDNHFEKKLTKQNIQNTVREIDKLKQQQQFYEISTESRLIYDRKQYLEYFKKRKEWPDKSVFESYDKNKKVHSNYQRNWTRGMASKKPIAKEKPKTTSEHH